MALWATALWVILAGPDEALHPLGALAVVLAVAVGLLLPAGRTMAIRLRAVPALLLFFLRRSVVGGLDVSFRAVHPRLPIHPGFIHYRCSLPHGPPLALFMAIVSLLPGTLSVRSQGRRVTVHVLNRQARPEEDLLRLEQRVADLFASPRFGERRGEGA